ncbi:hypothetical protein BB560_003825 [Smittium megazygosporum]|uniref:Copper-fist domain-containing protein n=1 Tax=Smittium megazygosporum TaxID=133381 RepID=A0A2T9ZAW6_9FUNG|nr:hypothetical protein BB560_003825 [Smittium megazygosporum]
MIIDGIKYACESCIRGHRANTCKHSERKLIVVKPKGRPITQCSHCRELRKKNKVHIRCICNSKPPTKAAISAQLKFSKLLNPCTCKLSGSCICCSGMHSNASPTPEFASSIGYFSVDNLYRDAGIDVGFDTYNSYEFDSYKFSKDAHDDLSEFNNLKVETVTDYTPEYMKNQPLLSFKDLIKSIGIDSPTSSSTSKGSSFADNIIPPNPPGADGCCGNQKDRSNKKYLNRVKFHDGLQRIATFESENSDISQISAISLCHKDSSCNKSSPTARSNASQPSVSKSSFLQTSAPTCCAQSGSKDKGHNCACLSASKQRGIVKDSDGAFSCACGCKKPLNECLNCVEDMCEEVIFRPIL